MSRKDNVFGLPVQVDSEAEIMRNAEAADTIYAVSRCVDLPQSSIPQRVRVRNRMTRCDNCKEMCWYDPQYFLPGVRVLCMHCLPPDTEIHVRQGQVDEIREFYPWA